MKKTATTETLLLEQLKRTPIVQIACEKIGISRMTYYRWREDEEFARKADEAMLEGHLLVNDLAESQLIGAVKDRNMPAIMYWLKHHHTDYKTRVELEGSINTIQDLSPEQKEPVRKALEMARINLTSHGEGPGT